MADLGRYGMIGLPCPLCGSACTCWCGHMASGRCALLAPSGALPPGRIETVSPRAWYSAMLAEAAGAAL